MDQGEDTQFGIEQVARFGSDAVFLVQQLVEVGHEVGEKTEERIIKFVIKL